MFKVLLAFLALFFGISDLLGESKSQKLEKYLIGKSKSQYAQLKINFQYIISISGFLIIIGITLLISIPYIFSVAFGLMDIDIPWLSETWEDILLIPLILVGVMCAFFSFGLLNSSLLLNSKSLKGTFERRILIKARLCLRKAIANYKKRKIEVKEGRRPQNPYGDDFPFMLGPIMSVFLFLSITILTIKRFILLILVFIMWLLWGLPLMVLNYIAMKLKNPSYLNIGKYLILIIFFIILIIEEFRK